MLLPAGSDPVGACVVCGLSGGAVVRDVHLPVPVVGLCVHGCLGQSVIGDYRPRDGHVERIGRGDLHHVVAGIEHLLRQSVVFGPEQVDRARGVRVFGQGDAASGELDSHEARSLGQCSAELVECVVFE